jgi:uncharacterized glyoxalase superfamily protein PhnB
MADKIPTQSCVTPHMAYRDAPKAIEWLCSVFGFKKHAIYPGENNTIMHAELTLGGGMLMLSSFSDGGYIAEFMKQPDQIGGAETRGVALVVPDADAVYTRAKAAGAEIVLDIEDKNYGGRGFTCRDLEGRLWDVGTYDPWQPK